MTDLKTTFAGLSLRNPMIRLSIRKQVTIWQNTSVNINCPNI